jgi:hypothetical protein
MDFQSSIFNHGVCGGKGLVCAVFLSIKVCAVLRKENAKNSKENNKISFK